MLDFSEVLYFRPIGKWKYKLSKSNSGMLDDGCSDIEVYFVIDKNFQITFFFQTT